MPLFQGFLLNSRNDSIETETLISSTQIISKAFPLKQNWGQRVPREHLSFQKFQPLMISSTWTSVVPACFIGNTRFVGLNAPATLGSSVANVERRS